MNDNELIAEFMGWRKASKGFMVPNTYPIIDGYDSGETEFTNEFLDFDTRWDWLIPVVQKIESIAPTRVIIDCNECRIVGDKRFKVHTLRKINSVYQCVVQFIKWYNEFSSTEKT